MNALAPIVMDFQPAYWQIEPMERKFVDGYVSDIERIADRTGQRLIAALRAPFPYELDNRSKAMIARPLVRAAIAERIRELSEMCDISIYRTLKELTAISYSNIKNYVKINELGEPEINLLNCTPEQMSAVKSFEVEYLARGGKKVKFVLHDKMAGLGMVMRYQGLLGEQNNHWQNAQETDKGAPNALPANIDPEAAADLWSREINR